MSYVLYNMEHQGFLLDLIHYHIINHKDTRAILLINTAQSNKTKGLKLDLFFENVIRYECNSFSKCDNEMEFITKLNTFFNNLLIENGIELMNIETIYTQSDCVDQFGLYLALNNTEFIILESYSELFSKKERYEASFACKSISKPLYDLQKKFGILCGENQKTILYANSESEPGFHYAAAFKEIDHNSKLKLLSCFGLDDDESFLDVQVLATNSLGWSMFVADTKEKRVGMYQTLADHYSNDDSRLIIKTHPQFDDITSYFPKGVVDNRGYNLELIKHVSKIKIRKIISPGSSSLKKLSDITNDMVIVGTGFCENYEIMDEIDVSLNLLKHIQVNNVNLDFTNEAIFIKSLSKKYNVKFVPKGAEATIYYKTEMIRSNSKFVLIISDSENLRGPDGYEYCFRVRINKNRITDSSKSIGRTSVFLYSKEDINELLSDFKYIKFSKCRDVRVKTELKTSNKVSEYTSDEIELILCEWVEKLISHDITWTRMYADLLVKSNILEYRKVAFEAYINLNRTVEEDWLLFRIAIMYRGGLGIQRSYEKSIQYMEKAAFINPKLIPDLIRTLMEADVSYKSRIKTLCMSNIDSKNPRLLGLIGEIYSDNKYVEQDLDLALRCFYRAAEYDSSWNEKINKLKVNYLTNEY